MMAKDPMSPATVAMFAWQSSWVFALRSYQLALQPGNAAGSLAEMVAEKQQAFADGMLAAGRAAMAGHSPDIVAAAAIRPSRRRVAANLRQLKRDGLA